uniref:Uncharacterized protein n=1 Tax=Peronospora matthiolae TaxID=2874970 RepID=A0AAV1TSV8_9STRA
MGSIFSVPSAPTISRQERSTPAEEPPPWLPYGAGLVVFQVGHPL